MTPELITKINVRILSQYTLGICNESNQKETAKLRGFIKDLRIEFPASFEDLEIANDIEILEEANDNYEKAYVGSGNFDEEITSDEEISDDAIEGVTEDVNS